MRTRSQAGKWVLGQQATPAIVWLDPRATWVEKLILELTQVTSQDQEKTWVQGDVHGAEAFVSYGQHLGSAPWSSSADLENNSQSLLMNKASVLWFPALSIKHVLLLNGNRHSGKVRTSVERVHPGLIPVVTYSCTEVWRWKRLQKSLIEATARTLRHNEVMWLSPNHPDNPRC